MHAPGDSGLFCESDVSGRDVALAAVRIGNAFSRKGFVSKIVLPPRRRIAGSGARLRRAGAMVLESASAIKVFL
jgi:hypothetical protein